MRLAKYGAAFGLVALLLVSGCSPADKKTGTSTPASTAPTAEQLGALTNADAGPATGASVGEVIRIEDIKKVLGRDDVVFATAL